MPDGDKPNALIGKWTRFGNDVDEAGFKAYFVIFNKV